MNIYSILTSIPHNKHYVLRYVNFISTRSNKGDEKHHLCPKSLFPIYKSFAKNPWNKIYLSYREHFIAHWMLWKAFGDHQSQAFKLMCCRLNKKSSRIYESVKKSHSLHMKVNNPNKGGFYSRKSWNESSLERRKLQGKLISNLNRQLKSKPKQLRYYCCLKCNKEVVRFEHTHHPISTKVFCCNSHRASYFNLLRKVSVDSVTKLN